MKQRDVKRRLILTSRSPRCYGHAFVQDVSPYPSRSSIALPQSPDPLQPRFAAKLRASDRLFCRSWWLLLCACIGLTGCRGAAYRDVYTQKMAGEIRNLEDQLYQADYENQVLHDRLSRAELKASQVQMPTDARRRSLFGKTLDDQGNVVDTPAITPVSPSFAPEAADSELQTPLQPAPEPTAPLLPARPIVPPTAAPENLVPPAEAMPPGKDDVTLPDVELGEPMPPRSADPADDQPEFHPGQIQLPDNAKRLGETTLNEPVAIRINPSLSGGSSLDASRDSGEGISILIEAIDETGKVVSLDRFDIDANLSVVLLDPELPAAQARIGKWDFGPDQIREMLRRELDSQIYGQGIHVLVPWGEQLPQSSKVIAHVRLSAAETLMQTSAELNVALPQVAEWTPRANMPKPRAKF